MSRSSSLQPSRRALALFAAGLVLAVLPAVVSGALWPLWLAFCALAALALGVDAALCPRADRLTAEPEVAPLVFMAADTEAVIRLALDASRPAGAEARVDVSDNLERPGTERFLLSASPAALTFALRPRRRGRARLETLWVRYDAPLGLVRRTVVLDLDVEVEAVPNVHYVRAAALDFFNAREAMAGLKVERFPGDGTDFHALREFAAGLDPRSIDWKASARHSRLLSRELRAERNHQIVLALDTGHLMAEPIDGAPLVDHAIHAALVLAYTSLRHGDRVGFFAFDERPHTYSPPRGGLAALPAFLELTGRLDYSSGETNFTLGLTDLTTRLRRRSLVIVLTDFVDSVTAELMVENVLRLRRRHLVLFVALRDPLLDAEDELEPRSLHELHRAVVADSLAGEREVVLRRLAKAGVAVIDAPPRRIGPALVNRYLEIKRRELI